jgi:hypothetical protein
MQVTGSYLYVNCLLKVTGLHGLLGMLAGKRKPLSRRDAYLKHVMVLATCNACRYHADIRLQQAVVLF